MLKASSPDFIGINYYFSICAKVKEGPVNYDQPPFWVSDAFDICDNPHLRKTEWMDKGIDPMGLHIGMRKVYNRYRLPMIVTENGMANTDFVMSDGAVHDPQRIDFVKRYLAGLQRAVDENIPVIGYLYWSIMDNFEWAEGYDKRFGLVYVDYQTQQRIPKDSFYWYADVIKNNRIS